MFRVLWGSHRWKGNSIGHCWGYGSRLPCYVFCTCMLAISWVGWSAIAMVKKCHQNWTRSQGTETWQFNSWGVWVYCNEMELDGVELEWGWIRLLAEWQLMLAICWSSSEWGLWIVMQVCKLCEQWAHLIFVLIIIQPRGITKTVNFTQEVNLLFVQWAKPKS